MEVKKILESGRFSQVGYVVKDIEESKRKFAALFGCEVPPTVGCGDYEVTKTTYKGQPAPEAACVMAFFNLSTGVQLELIQPNEAPSTWREALDANGEGIHHIAFQCKNMDAVIADCEAAGMTLVQRGLYGDASGQYAYLDGSNDYKCLIELLESF
jgi:methylmalonyl-CoA/ethylmalonyl-CoA epimerase